MGFDRRRLAFDALIERHTELRVEAYRDDLGGTVTDRRTAAAPLLERPTSYSVTATSSDRRSMSSSVISRPLVVRYVFGFSVIVILRGWQQFVVRRPERHGMDRHQSFVGEDQHHDLQQTAGTVPQGRAASGTFPPTSKLPLKVLYLVATDRRPNGSNPAGRISRIGQSRPEGWS
jgi:hypothetical protein